MPRTSSLLWQLLLSMMATLPAWAAQPSWRAPIELSKGPGERGPWQQNDSRFRYVDDGTVQFAADGALYTAWVDQVQKDVLFQRRDVQGRALTAPLNISRSPETFSWLPRIAALPGSPRVVLVLWQEIIFAGGAHGGDILLARSSDCGASFAPPINLSASVGGDGKGRITREIWHNGSQDIVAAANGVVHVAWTEYDGQLWHTRSTDGGQHFPPPRQIAGSAERPARAPTMALAADGRLFLAFTTGEDAASDIQLMHSTDQGISFSAPRPVSRTTGYSDAPKLAVDDNAVLHLAWAESADGPFAPSRIHYARSRDHGASFEAARELPPVSAGEAGSSFPALAVSGPRVILLWESLPRADARPRGLGMAISDNGGHSFGPPFRVPHSADVRGGDNGSVQGLLMKKLAVDASGRLAIVNSALKEGQSSRVWLLRGQIPAAKPGK